MKLGKKKIVPFRRLLVPLADVGCDDVVEGGRVDGCDLKWIRKI